MAFFYAFLIFISFASFASFLGVVLSKDANYKRILVGRSKCQSCGHTLEIWDLIPVFSYLGLRGKCRYCKSPIAIRLLWAELIVGLVGVFVFWLLGGFKI